MSRLFSGECSLILVISDYMSCNSSLFTVCCWGVGWLCSVWVQEVMPSPLTLYCGPFQWWHWALYKVPVWGMSILTWHLVLGLVLWCSVTSRPSTELGSGIALLSESHELVAKGTLEKCGFEGEEWENFNSSLPPEYANRHVGIFFYWICIACSQY